MHSGRRGPLAHMGFPKIRGTFKGVYRGYIGLYRAI